ncbi:hypothetical protein ACWDUL_30700 [Nocardia niigatensis]|nr:hypothetical protein [Nocardia niigatensis]
MTIALDESGVNGEVVSGEQTAMSPGVIPARRYPGWCDSKDGRGDRI